MSNETLLYICGITLAVSAVTVSLVGLKVNSFPGKAMPLVVLWFAIFVVGSTTFAVLHAKDEDANKAKEARYEKAGEKFEREGGHVAPLGPEGQEEGGEAEAEESKEGFEEVEGEGTEGGEAGEEAPEEGGAEGSGEGVEGEKEAATTGGNPEAGAMVFAENCSVCHGEDGHGGAGGPDLRTMPKAQEEATAIEQVTDGGGGMPPFGGVLNEEEIKNVASFVVQKVVGKG
jgi:mono/diheme cytochrome c family protein